VKILYESIGILQYRDDNLEFSHCDELLGFIQFCGSAEALGYYKELSAYSEHSVEECCVFLVFWGWGSSLCAINQYLVGL